MGVERIASLMERLEPPKPHFFFALLGEEARRQMLPIMMQLRREGIPVEMDYAGEGLKKQMGLADKLGARYTLIVGENELRSGKMILRDMTTKAQQDVALSNLNETLRAMMPPRRLR